MFRKLILFVIILFSIFFSDSAMAQQVQGGNSQLPALNPFCWKRKDCREVRANYITGNPTQEELDNGFVTGDSVAPCLGGGPLPEEEWGKCLPAGQSKTEISFGGKSSFANIGQFILLMYNYLVGIASIVAVIMIILAGVQWVTSGGNSETISSAKHRIGGAVIGLFIAYLSYFILNTINPALVNLRLPQVWLIRPEYLIPKYCNQIEGATSGTPKFFYAADENSQAADVDSTKASKDELAYTKEKGTDGKEVFYCGRRFFAEGSGTQTCLGNLCPSVPGNRQSCSEDDDSGYVSCQQGELVIRYVIDVRDDLKEQASIAAEKVNKGIFITSMMHVDWMNDDTFFWGVCDNNGVLYLANDGEGVRWNDSDHSRVNRTRREVQPYWEYTIRFSKLADPEPGDWQCRGGGNLVGYFLRNETSVNESAWEKYGSIFMPVAIYRLFQDSPSTEPNLNIGYNRQTGQALYGSFSQDVGRLSWDELINDMVNRRPSRVFENYIPITELKENGVRLDVRLTIGKIAKMRYRGTETPGDFNIKTTGDYQQQLNRLTDELRAIRDAVSNN